MLYLSNNKLKALNSLRNLKDSLTLKFLLFIVTKIVYFGFVLYQMQFFKMAPSFTTVYIPFYRRQDDTSC